MLERNDGEYVISLDYLEKVVHVPAKDIGPLMQVLQNWMDYPERKSHVSGSVSLYRLDICYDIKGSNWTIGASEETLDGLWWAINCLEKWADG